MTALASALKVRASGDAAQPTRPDLGLATTDLEDAIQAATVHARASGASPHAVRIIAAAQAAGVDAPARESPALVRVAR